MNNIDKGPAGTKTFTLRTGSSVKLNNYLDKINMLIHAQYINDFKFIVFLSGLVKIKTKPNHLK